MTEIEYWPSHQVKRTPAFYLKLAKRYAWPHLLGDDANIKDIHWADEEQTLANVDFNENPKLTPPEWKRYTKVTPEADTPARDVI